MLYGCVLDTLAIFVSNLNVFPKESDFQENNFGQMHLLFVMEA
jgi:hypothetical protein